MEGRNGIVQGYKVTHQAVDEWFGEFLIHRDANNGRMLIAGPFPPQMERVQKQKSLARSKQLCRVCLDSPTTAFPCWPSPPAATASEATRSFAGRRRTVCISIIHETER